MAGLALSAGSLVAALPATAQTAPPAAPPRAWILVDADTGKVMDAGNERVPLPPASLSKVFTALTAERLLPRAATLGVSPHSATAPPSLIGMKPGQTWRLDDAMHALLMVSANDAAEAVAERMAGSLAGYRRVADQTAALLGLADHPLIQDPAGLDDGSSVGGGNLVSARDLAIGARALLADPALAPVVALREYRFHGGDGRDHHLLNHNKLLSRYTGLLGVKTGYTRKAGGCLIAAARRSGRTMLTVVLGSGDIYGSTKALLDRGFATKASAEKTAGRLPAVFRRNPPAPRRKVPSRPAPQKPVHLRLRRAAAVTPGNVSLIGLAVAPLAVMVALRIRRLARARH